MDTCGCVFLLDNRAAHFPLARDLFLEAARGRLAVEVAGITLMELLVRPARSGDRREMEIVMTLTKRQAGVVTMPISEMVLMTAAHVRASTRLKAPDALVVASAALSGCDAIIGNDKDFRVINDIAGLGPIGVGGRTLRMPQYIHFDDYNDESPAPVKLPRRTS